MSVEEVHDERRDTARQREINLRLTRERHTYDKLRDRQRITRSSSGGFRSYGDLLRWAEDQARKDIERLYWMERDIEDPKDKVT